MTAGMFTEFLIGFLLGGCAGLGGYLVLYLTDGEVILDLAALIIEAAFGSD